MNVRASIVTPAAAASNRLRLASHRRTSRCSSTAAARAARRRSRAPRVRARLCNRTAAAPSTAHSARAELWVHCARARRRRLSSSSSTAPRSTLTRTPLQMPAAAHKTPSTESS
eukprot:scaffold79270_cov67-Phaeocystis_antarctica.AAC.1